MIKVDNKKLIVETKRSQQKYLVLLSDQTVVIDTEWQAMKKALAFKKPIIEMLPTTARIHAQVNGLSKLLESLEITKP